MDRLHGGGGAVALLVVGHSAGADLPQVQTGLSEAECLDVALLVDAQHDRVCRCDKVESNRVAQLSRELWIVRELELTDLMPCQAVIKSDPLHRTDRIAAVCRHGCGVPVGRFAGGGGRVKATRHSATEGTSGVLRDGRVLPRISSSAPSWAKSSYHRETAGLATPALRTMALVPRPAAVSSTIRQPETCFCGLLRFATIASRWTRSVELTVKLIPGRMPQPRTPTKPQESFPGFRR